MCERIINKNYDFQVYFECLYKKDIELIQD